MGRLVVRSAAAVGGGGGGSVDLGTVTNYAGFSIGLGGLRTLDTSLGDTPTRTTGDASVVTNSAYGVGGRYGTRCYPPATTGEYSGLGSLNLFNAGSSTTVRCLYSRWYFQVGSAWSANNTFDAVKLWILQYGSPTSTRPIFYLDGRPGNGLGIGPANTSVLSPAQGTTKRFCTDYPTGFTAYDGNNRFDCYMGAGAATTVTDPSNSAVRQVLAASEWICFESITDSTTGGVGIKQRLTRQTGAAVISDITLPWDLDPAAVFDEGVTNVDTWGYYNGVTTAAGANNYYALDRYITFEAGRSTFATTVF